MFVLSSYFRYFLIDNKEGLACLYKAMSICQSLKATNSDCYRFVPLLVFFILTL